jgi:glycine cleavage system H protein
VVSPDAGLFRASPTVADAYGPGRVSSESMNVPDELRYSTDHEWIRSGSGRVTVGITDYAQDALGDIVFVDLPVVGVTVDARGLLGEVESTKSVSEIYAPVAGEVVAVNTSLADAPERLNEDPYGEGWICEVVPSDPAAEGSLMDAAAYRQLIAD